MRNRTDRRGAPRYARRMENPNARLIKGWRQVAVPRPKTPAPLASRGSDKTRARRTAGADAAAKRNWEAEGGSILEPVAGGASPRAALVTPHEE